MEGFVYPNEAEIGWSVLIVLYPFITGLVAGAFVVSSLYHVFGMKALKPVARLALITALAFLLVAPLPLQAHLGRPERAFLIFLTPNFTSAMAGFGYIWMAYLVLVVAETWLVFREDIVRYAREKTGPLRLVYQSLTLGVHDVSEEALAVDHRLSKILAAIGIPAAAMLHGYVGFIFGAIKANPWWSTPLMPVIFFLSAIVSGIALLLVLYVVSMKLLHRPIDHDCVRTMAGLLAGFLMIDLALEGLEILTMAYEQEESWEVVSGLLRRIAPTFVGVQLVLGSLIPLTLLGVVTLLKPRYSTAIATLGGMLVVIGVFAMRWNIVVGGQMISKSLRGYVDYHYIFGGREGFFMAAIVLLIPLLLYAALCAILPPWEDESEEAEELAPAPDREPVLAGAYAAAPRAAPLSLAPAPSTGIRTRYLQPLLELADPRQYLALKMTLSGTVGMIGVLLFAALVVPGKPGLLEIGGSTPPRVLVPELRSVFPAPIIETFYDPGGAEWVEPIDLTVMGNRIFVVDHTQNSLIELDRSGAFVRRYDEQNTPGLVLLHSHTIADDGTNIYVGNTFPPRIYVLDPDAGLQRTIELPPSEAGVASVPTGLALTPAGNIVVSDGQNHRLLELTPDGRPVRTISRGPGSWQLLLPGSPMHDVLPGAPPALTDIATAGRPGSVGVAPGGTLLALDILGAGLTWVLPSGELGGTFARPDDPATGIFRPTDVAIDADGRIYVSDDLIQGIQVYGPDGKSLGVIGRKNPNSFLEPTEIERPSALTIQDNELYVMDRGRGIVIYQIPAGAALGKSNP